MAWYEVATPDAVDLAERAVLAALSPWIGQEDETFGRELALVLGEIADHDALRENVLVCAVTLAALALTDITEHDFIAAARQDVLVSSPKSGEFGHSFRTSERASSECIAEH